VRIEPLPPARSGTVLRILATSDLGARVVPLPTSYGDGGTCAGIVELLERERERQPAIWLDSGDLVVGNPAYTLLGSRPWEDVADLPIAAAAVGNHEFDDGVPALLEAAQTLSYPLLCANVDVGLPPTALLDTPVGALGAVGLTHSESHRSSNAPPPTADWQERVRPLAGELREAGARWVVALWHDGVDWWPSNGGIEHRTERLARLAKPWAAEIDVILAGHNQGAWSGNLAGTPAGHASVYASSVLVVDLAEPPAEPDVRGVFQVPAVEPPGTSAAIEATEAAAAEAVAESGLTWLTRTGADHYLPHLFARALREATGAEAAFVVPGYHGSQAPLDGTITALQAGPVTTLDLIRIVGDADEPVIAHLRPGELAAVVEAYERTADPANAAGDGIWWNWCRMPCGTSGRIGAASTVAVIPDVVRHLNEWLGRDVAAEPSGVSARAALVQALD
jgi:2',3'-cyclic-nucleotide 2'-phosphodiesterase (5'-nucleotidase family)